MTRKPVKIVLTFFKKHLKSIIIFVVAFILGFALGGHFYMRALGVIANVFRNTSGDIDMNIFWTAIGAATTGFLGWAAVSQNKRLIRLEELKESPYLSITENFIQISACLASQRLLLNFKNSGCGGAYAFQVENILRVTYNKQKDRYEQNKVSNVFVQQYIPPGVFASYYFDISSPCDLSQSLETVESYFSDYVGTNKENACENKAMCELFLIEFSFENVLKQKKRETIKLVCTRDYDAIRIDQNIKEDTTDDNT